MVSAGKETCYYNVWLAVSACCVGTQHVVLVLSMELSSYINIYCEDLKHTYMYLAIPDLIISLENGKIMCLQINII